MKNPIARTAAKLMPAASAAIAGLTLHAEPLGLSYVTADAMTSALAELILASNNHKQGQFDLKWKRLSAEASVASARSFGVLARDILKPALGSQHSQAWNVAGFATSLTLPSRLDDLIPVMIALGGHLTAHPELQNAALNVTPARATAIKDDLIARKNAVAQQRGELDRLFQVREDKAKVIYNNLRTLFTELTMALDPLDSRWVEFGFNKPGALQTPDVPEDVTATLVGATSAAVNWGRAPRAERYRVWMKVNGVDQELVVVGSPYDANFTIDGLPANSTIQIAVSAVNNGGESATSEVVTIVTH